MVSRAVAVSLLMRLASPKHQEELLDTIKCLEEFINFLEELDMRQEFNKLALHLELKRRVDSMVDSMASLLDIAQVVPIFVQLPSKSTFKHAGCGIRGHGGKRWWRLRRGIRWFSKTQHR